MELNVLVKMTELQICSRNELLEQWQEWFGKNAPRYISQQLLLRGIAYKIQEKVYGGLATDVKRVLDFSAKGDRRQQNGLNTSARISADIAVPLTDTLGGTRRAGKSSYTQRSITSLNHTKSGTRFIREWKGELYEVTAARDGFVYQGNNYKSLSEIARLITGTRWNGPAFFGLRKSTKSASSDHKRKLDQQGAAA